MESDRASAGLRVQAWDTNMNISLFSMGAEGGGRGGGGGGRAEGGGGEGERGEGKNEKNVERRTGRGTECCIMCIRRLIRT